MMKQCVLCLVVILLCTVSGSAQSRSNLPNAIKEDIRHQLERELTVDNDEMTKMLDGLEAYQMELNGDDKPEWKVVGGYGLCGNRSCYCWFYRKVGNKYEMILPRGYGDDMKPSKTRTNGYRDLLSSGGIFKFNGRRYQFQARN